jgi:XTP/dITP diphosphohydrolase
MEQLIFATNNLHKLTEVKSMLQGLYHVVGMAEAGITDDIPEEAETLEGNALEKARYLHRLLGQNIIADDTGLEIEALDGEPGVYSARYAGPQKNPADNMQKVLDELWGVTNRKAQFRCVICLILHNQEHLFEGVVEGEILHHPTGQGGFGYDPIFKPKGFLNSFAELPPDTKNQISHRGIAVAKMVAFLKSGAL